MSLNFQRVCVPLFLSAALLAACGGKDEAKLLDSAKAFMQKRDNKSATIELKTLLQQSPNHGEGRFLLGQTLLAIGDVAGAEAELRRALEFKYSRDAVLPVLARTLLLAGQNGKLIKELGKETLADKAAQSDLLVSLSMAYLAENQLPAGEQAVNAALALTPEALPALMAQARIQATGGDIDGAIGRLDAALAKNPQSAQALLLKAEMLLRGKGEREAAIQTFKQVISIEPASFDAHAALITIALSHNQPAQAREQLNQLKKAGVGASKTQYLEAQLSFAEGDFKKARELLQALRRHAPDHVPMLTLAAATELQLNALTEADALASRAAQLAPNQPPIQRLQAQTLLRMHQPAKALAVLKPLVEVKDPDAEALSLAGQALLMQGDSKGSDEFFQRAAKARPDDLKLRAALAMSELGKGNASTALRDLASIAAADKGSGVDMALISAQIRRKDVNGALRAIEALELKMAGSPVPDSLRGQLYLTQNDAAKARKFFEASLARDANFLVSVGGMAAVDMMEKKPDAARARLQDFVKAHPKNVQARLALAELMARSGVPAAEVEQVVAEAVRIDPVDASARLMQLDLLLSGRDAKATLAAAQAAVAALPNNIDILERLARAQLASGDRAQALNNYARISNLAPENPAGPWGAAQIHIAAQDFVVAQRDLRRVLEISPDNLQARELAVQVALKLQKPQEAMQQARELQTRQPKLAMGYLAEGQVEQDQKRWDQALAAYRKALALPEPAEAPLRVHAALVGAQRLPEAQSFADSWQKAHPDDLRFGTYLADQLMAKGDLAGAEKSYQELLKRRPDLVPALNNIAWIRASQKRPGAVEMAEKAVKLSGEQPAIMDTYATALAAEGKLAQALTVQQKVVQLAPDVSDFRLNLATYLIQSGSKAQALTELQKLSKLGKAYARQTEVSALLRQAN
ncbi:PEP-CTERM system TPR-repeat protein PrsT [Paucibacter sp. APW11]|uniref:PEP-CTERM system TPR-repeat protein PrsT n=1 Tax=Roseateles aquae TaxID=3077235 RepID=A0ABU3P911_9BURK|nr:XrtA/PEP-CTERM system TPR-repeat protein PrsT [Paucibacter sp. APW11]MDT8998983.1 PEP-CTERM system TPR-repeat protein PrsT [Paucibacter sp. APW11]